MKACARSRWCCYEPLSVSKAVFILQEAQQKRAPFRLLFGRASVNNPSGSNCLLFQTRLYVHTHTHQSEIDLEILGWQVECWISREALLFQQRDAPVWACWYSPKLSNELSPETPLGNLNHSPSNIKAYGRFDMYEGKT